jgi:hypothetical protein
LQAHTLLRWVAAAISLAMALIETVAIAAAAGPRLPPWQEKAVREAQQGPNVQVRYAAVDRLSKRHTTDEHLAKQLAEYPDGVLPNRLLVLRQHGDLGGQRQALRNPPPESVKRFHQRGATVGFGRSWQGLSRRCQMGPLFRRRLASALAEPSTQRLGSSVAAGLVLESASVILTQSFRFCYQ